MAALYAIGAMPMTRFVIMLAATATAAWADPPRPACAPFTVTANYGKQATILVDVVPKLDVQYNWSVSQGTLSSGQGTSSVVVDTTGVPKGTPVEISLTVGGLPLTCPANVTNVSGTVKAP